MANKDEGPAFLNEPVVGWNGEIKTVGECNELDLKFQGEKDRFFGAVATAAGEGTVLLGWLIEQNGVEGIDDLPETILAALMPVVQPLMNAADALPKE